MKELSVMVLGSGRWARALVSVIKHNQQKQRGVIARVMQYSPPQQGIAAPGQVAMPAMQQMRAKPKSANPDDATMMHMTADAMAAAAAELGIKPPGLTSSSEDATMMAMTADALEKVAGSRGGGKAPPGLTSSSEDATMMNMTADRLAGVTAPRASVPSLTADSDDATIMNMSDRIANLAGDAQGNPQKDIGSADLLLLSTPAGSVRTLLRGIRKELRPHQMLVHSVGGFFPADRAAQMPASLISDIILQDTPLTRIGALAGPATAEDMEEWSPAALVCGSESQEVVAATRQVLGCPTLRIYGNGDMIGVEVSHAMNAVVALASGICDVLQFGLCARAMMVSRSTAEITRLGLALGGKEKTFLGLAGIGGLMVASQRTDSPEFQLGRLLGSGIPLADAQKEIGRPCDSPMIIRDAYSIAESAGVRTPILTALNRLAFGKAEVSRAIKDLLDDPNFAE